MRAHIVIWVDRRCSCSGRRFACTVCPAGYYCPAGTGSATQNRTCMRSLKRARHAGALAPKTRSRHERPDCVAAGIFFLRRRQSARLASFARRAWPHSLVRRLITALSAFPASSFLIRGPAMRALLRRAACTVSAGFFCPAGSSANTNTNGTCPHTPYTSRL